MERLTVDFEIKQFSDDDEFFTFEGFASTFGNVDLQDDIILPGAFRDSLKKRTPVILWQHRTGEPIGVPSEIFEDENGLVLKGKLPKADDFVRGRVMPQMKIGSIKSMSIGFSIAGPEGAFTENGLRFLKKIDLFEVSLVTFPANPLAMVSGFKNIPVPELLEFHASINEYLSKIKNDKSETSQHEKHGCEKMKKLTVEDLDEIETVRELENFLKDTGFFTQKACKLLISKFYGGQREADPKKTESQRDAEDTKKNKDADQWDADKSIKLLKEMTATYRGQGYGGSNERPSTSSG